ncbi:hypothetical protein M9Y10_013720 [Tritrichomonas musculus]|uniref:Uncharacterized protein n=1 Tax=Tritrichomonas musculus TaxID=1915356 RepID=A0ABR2L0T6_9EUKA
MAITLANFSSYSPDIKFSFTNTEYDLSEYQDKLASRRDENSLFLRRVGHAGTKKSTNKFYGSNLGTDIDSLTTNKMYFIQSLDSHDSQQIVALYSNFPNIKNNCLPILASDEQIIGSLINAFISLDDLTFEAKTVLLDILISIVEISSEKVTEKLIDELSLTISLVAQNSLEEMSTNDMLENGCENSKLLPLILKLIQTFTAKSLYSRSAMISFGILDSLILIASKNVNDDLTNQCLLSIRSIFSKNVTKSNNLNYNPLFISGTASSSSDQGMKVRRIRSTRSAPNSISLNQLCGLNNNGDPSSEMDFEIDINDVDKIIDPLFDLLHIKSNQNENYATINIILNIFVELTNMLPILIKRFYEKGLFQYSLNTLAIPELMKPSLNLIGNLPIYNSISFIQNMIENGLFPRLMQLIQNIDHTSIVFWILSNYLEAAPQFIIPLIDINLINLSVGIGEQSSFHVKREIAYFLSTLIIFINNESAIKSLFNERTIDLIAEMLNSGVENLMIRCIFAFQKILGLAVQSGSIDFNADAVLQMFDNSDVVKQLDEIVQQIDQNNTTLISIASKLLYDIHSLTNNQ